MSSRYTNGDANCFASNLRFSKKFFWFSEEPVKSENLTTYVRETKADIAHPTAAWASQTGKGLLFYAKRAEDKATPAGIIKLVSYITFLFCQPRSNIRLSLGRCLGCNQGRCKRLLL